MARGRCMTATALLAMRLALRAEVHGSRAERETRNGALAGQARVPTVDVDALGPRNALALGCEKAARRDDSPVDDSLLQQGAGERPNLLNLVFWYFAGGNERVQAQQMQNLGPIHIPDACDDALVHQCDADGYLRSPEVRKKRAGSASSRRGSGPRRSTMAFFWVGVTRSHAVGPRRSMVTLGPSRRRRTVGAGGFGGDGLRRNFPKRPR